MQNLLKYFNFSRILWVFIILICFGGCKPEPKIVKRECGTMHGYADRLKNDSLFAKNEAQLEEAINNYLALAKTGQLAAFRSGVVRIPVVVHVVYENSTENISDAQIQSQIDVLNEDFRRLNADVSTVPSAFSGLVADARIEFVLAQRDPNCNPTNGITRTSTTETSFTFDPNLGTASARNPVKFDSSGGKDGWPSDEYLNFWVCDLAGSLLGYGAFPSDMATRPTEDGVVMDYEFFGTTGTATAPFDLGRTTTHEIGHWLNLRHIWGDDQNLSNTCSGSDFVADTPNQAVFNVGCPTHPQNSCGSDDMFMNFMDYVDDACMVMFSNGQSDRMDAVLYTTRASIVGSQGDLPPPTVAQDLFMRDKPDDVGDEPNVTSSPMYRSEDIWVRNSNDGFTNQEHENAIGGSTNYVYVRVRNQGCGTADSGDLFLYWAKAGSGLGWPAPWDGSVTSPALMGGLIGQQPTGSVASSESVVLEYPFVAPDPIDYASFGSNQRHFCLLARIQTSPTSPFGMTFTETNNLNENVRNNNNIVWKNITIDESASGGRFSSVLISNYTPKRDVFKLVFRVPEGELPLFDLGRITVMPSKDLMKRWEEGGKSLKNIELSNGGLVLKGNNAVLDNITLSPNESIGIGINFEADMNKMQHDRNLLQLDMEQYRAEDDEFIGAQSFFIKLDKKVLQKDGV